MVFVFAVGSLIGVGSMLPGGIGAAEASMAGMFKFYAGLAAGPAVGVDLPDTARDPLVRRPPRGRGTGARESGT